MEKKQSIVKKILANAFYNFLSAIISKLGGLIFTIVAARLLLPELFGIYSIALTVILTIATFTDLGINSTIVRFLADSIKKKNKFSGIEARSRLSFLFKFKIIITAVISILLFLLSDIISIYIFNKPLLAVPIKIGSVYLFLISVQGFLTSIFYALQKIKYNALAEIIFQFLRIALLILFIYLYKNAGSVFTALAIALFVSFVFLYLFLSKKYSFLIKGEKKELSKKEKNRLLSFFGWLTISSISSVFFIHIDTFMLGIFMPAEFAGYYNSLVNLTSAVIAFVCFGSVVLPVFTQLRKEKLEQGFKKAVRYTAMIAIPFAIGLAFFAVPIVKMVFGPAYVPEQYKTAIIIVALLLSLLTIETALTGILSTIFQAKEKPKIPSLLVLIFTMINILLNYILLKAGISISISYGLVGVALATVLARYGNLFSLVILTKKELKIKSVGANVIIKPLIASIIMLLFLFGFKFLFNFSILTGILSIIFSVCIYFFVMILIRGFKRKDFELIKKMFITP